ncbi:MAG: ribbon-helix-helix domain-containing protein [Nanoarchaeota archaeon]
METVTFKLHEKVLKEIDGLLAPLHFNNRTEFIREAVREKLNQIDAEKFMKRLAQHKGAAKIKISDERLRGIKEEIAKKYAAKFGVSLE